MADGPWHPGIEPPSIGTVAGSGSDRSLPA